ncbi:MAG: TerC family protein [Thaumarchaeota archaeon]|nr:TerC family protein [Nitrososphaerota archaeon]
MDATLWVVFNVFVVGMLVVDLGIVNRKSHVIAMREAAVWSSVWIGLAMVFNAVIYFVMGEESAFQYLTGYIIEKSLSVDNMFIFAIIFSYFHVPQIYQPRVLKWGIIGAVLMRFALILAGAAVLEAFHWMIYVFGGAILVTGVRMLVERGKHVEPEKNPAVKLLRKIIPITDKMHEEKFFVKTNGVRHATPLFLVLVVVEFTDLVFAVDSIPAIFAITTDTFIVYTSNIFAILGLRALYFLLAGAIRRFAYLKMGLAIILLFVGGKMVLSDLVHISTTVSLAVVLGILGVAILASYIRSKKTSPEALEMVDKSEH